METKTVFNLDRGEGDGRKAAKRRAWSSIADRPFSVASGPVERPSEQELIQQASSRAPVHPHGMVIHGGLSDGGARA